MKALLLAALVAVTACGVKGRPLPPEVVQPQPPSELLARSTVDGVRLTWRRPTEYSGGRHMRDLAGFDVERADGAESVDFRTVGTVELTDLTRFRQEPTIEWTDTDVTDGASYHYRVTAFTSDGYRSPPTGVLAVRYQKPAGSPPAP